MKKIIGCFLFSILTFSSQSQNINEQLEVFNIEQQQNSNIIHSGIIENLEIAEEDFPEMMNWENAKKTSEELGGGWRLPTTDELNEMYKNREEIGGFAYSSYWSSTEYDYEDAWAQFFDETGFPYNISKTQEYSVRAVRDL